MKLSQKKKTELYQIVYDEIMDARVRIAILLSGEKNSIPIDNILSELGMNASRKAIDFFNSSKPELKFNP